MRSNAFAWHQLKASVNRHAPGLLLFAVASLAIPSEGNTQGTWVGRVTIGDLIREDVTKAIEAQQQATIKKAEFNSRIASARRAFLATAQTPNARATAESNFAKLLLEKDLYFLIMHLNEGFSDRSIAIVRGLEAISGGPLDKGIPSDGRVAFEAWVRGVRASLGAPRDGQFPAAALQPGRLQQAIQATDPLYQEYKRLRDRQEINGGVGDEQRAQIAEAKEIADARMPDGGVRLFKKELYPVYSGVMYGLVKGELYSWMTNAAKNGQQTIQCTYGPSLSATGSKVYGSYSFWYDRTPSDIQDMLSRDKNQALRFLGARALKECPESNKAALALRRTIMTEHPLGSTLPPNVPIR